MNENKILVTGGSGFFGQLLIKCLIEQGHEVGSLDINPPNDLPKYVNFHQVDILDTRKLDDCISNYNIVLHNVAQVPLAKDKFAFEKQQENYTKLIEDQRKLEEERKRLEQENKTVKNPETDEVESGGQFNSEIQKINEQLEDKYSSFEMKDGYIFIID